MININRIWFRIFGFEKEINSQSAFSVLTLIFIALWIVVVIPSAIIAFISSPLWIPINYVLKKNGRKGFARIESGDKRGYHLVFDHSGFEKA